VPIDGGSQQLTRPDRIAALECSHTGLQELFAFPLPLGDRAPRAFDIRAGAEMRPIQKEDTGPDADCELVLSAEIMVESDEEQFLDSR
jgi:hypothetical protein